MNNNGQAGWFVIIPIGAILAWFGLTGLTSQPTTGQSEERVVTMGQYNQVNRGMSVSDVQSIMGSRGEEAASSGDLDNHCEVVSWQNPDGSNMVVTFENGYVSSKTQSGL